MTAQEIREQIQVHIAQEREGSQVWAAWQLMNKTVAHLHDDMSNRVEVVATLRSRLRIAESLALREIIDQTLSLLGDEVSV